MANISATCDERYEAVRVSAHGSAVAAVAAAAAAATVVCNASRGARTSFLATCESGSFRVAHKCVPIKCEPAKETWGANVLSIVAAPPDLAGGINVTCNTGFRPTQEAVPQYSMQRWHVTQCASDCTFTSLPCSRSTPLLYLIYY